MKLPLRSSPLRRYFERNDGHLIDKWMHYFDVYERHFAPFRRTDVRLLEIGISHGGSLQMWRSYLGRRATIVGVDIEPRVDRAGRAGHRRPRRQPVRPGVPGDGWSTSTAASTSSSTTAATGTAISGVSLDVLWPALSEGGVYLVEDVHTSYLATYEGGRGVADTFVGAVKERIDDLHGFWIDGQAPLARESRASDGSAINEWTTTIAGIHVYDSVVVLDKATRDRPVRRMTGRPAFDTLYDHPVEGFIDDAHRAQLASLNRPVARLRRAIRDPRGTLGACAVAAPSLTGVAQPAGRRGFTNALCCDHERAVDHRIQGNGRGDDRAGRHAGRGHRAPRRARHRRARRVGRRERDRRHRLRTRHRPRRRQIGCRLLRGDGRLGDVDRRDHVRARATASTG